MVIILFMPVLRLALMCLYVDIDTSMFAISPYARQSYLPLEVDVAAYHILNPRFLQARNIHNTLTIPAPALPSEPLVLSVRELWEDERKRRLIKGLPPTPVMPSDGSGGRGEGPGWRAEPRLRSELEHRIERERDDGLEYAPNPASRAWERFVMTAFESKEALWPPEHKKWKPAETAESPFHTPDDAEASSRSENPSTSKDDTLDLDEGFLTSQRMEDLMSIGETNPATEDFDKEDDLDSGIPENDYARYVMILSTWHLVIYIGCV